MIPLLFFFMIVWVIATISLVVIVRFGATTKKSLLGALIAFTAVVYSTYWIAEFDGRGRYYGALRAELSPFLRKLSSAPEEKKKEGGQKRVRLRILILRARQKWLNSLHAAQAAIGISGSLLPCDQPG